MSLNVFRFGGAKEAAEALVFCEGSYEITAALINALLRIDTLEKQVETLSKDLAKVALARRKYVSDGNLNKDQP
jgi:hypothetical protein